MEPQKKSLTCILRDKHHGGGFHFDHWNINSPPLYFVAAIKLFLSGLKLAGITGPARDASKRGTKIDIAKSREPRKCRCRILNIMRIPLVLVLAHPFDRTLTSLHPAAHRRSDPRIFRYP